MDRPHMRPRLEIRVDATVDEVRSAFAERVAHPTCDCEAQFARNHLLVMVSPHRRHRWSPVLDVNLRETSGGTLLLGRFGPHPDLWTLYVFLYSTCAFVGVVAGCGALAQLAMDQAPWGLVGVAVAAFLAAILWISGRLGARWGHDQMEELYRMVDGLGAPHRDEAHVVHHEPVPS